MKILYVTDLHGCEWKYRKVIKTARAWEVDAVLNGGDMYPKNIGLEEQHKFIRRFLDRHFAEYNQSKIHFLCMPGNDDLAAFDKLFDSICRKYPHVFNIAQRKVELGGFEFLGFNWVADYPFALKDRCRMDTLDAAFQRQLGTPVVSKGSWPDFRGFKSIDRWFEYAMKLPTIEDELNRQCPLNPDKAVYMIHMPPSGVGLDECNNGRKVGSGAVRSFLIKTQPRLSLHGHIHESPQVSGVWKAKLGQTVLVQPGQTENHLTFVAIDLDSLKMERMQSFRNIYSSITNND